MGEGIGRETNETNYPYIFAIRTSLRSGNSIFFFKLSKKRRKKKCNDDNPSENVENIKILTRVPQTHVPHRYFPSILQRRQTFSAIVSSPLRPIQSPIREARNHGDHARDSCGWVKGESLQMRKCVAGSQGSGARPS